MTGEGELDGRGEDPDGVGTLAALGDEGGLTEVGLTGDRLHPRLGTGVEDHAERVARQRPVGEDVDDSIAHRAILAAGFRDRSPHGCSQAAA